MHANRLILLSLALCGLLLVTACAVNPVTGEQQLMLLSEQDEIQLGLKTDQSVIEQYGVYEDELLQGYLQKMGRSMATLSHRPDLEWQFKVMDSPVVNAFAAPGGYVYVTRGLLAAVNNEAELAGVIGHEIGHVTARHSAQQYSNKVLASLGLSLGQQLLGDYGDLLGPVLETGAGLLFLKFSRDDEREADALGVEYASRSGYDAARMADFFVTLQRQPAAEGGQAERLPEFFSTHPNPVNREANVRAMARDWQARVANGKFLVNQNQFLARVDGLVYGEDPRKGFHENGWYYLPQFAVKLPVPPQWRLEREGNNLQLSHPEGKAATLVSIRAGMQSVDAVANFLAGTGAQVHQDRSLSHNGTPLRLLLSTIDSGGQRTVVISHFYQLGKDVFAFHGLTSEANYASYKDLMQMPATGFSALTDPALMNRKPRRIAVKSVTRATTLDGFLRDLRVDRQLWPEIAWLNGRQGAETLAAGERLKILE